MRVLPAIKRRQGFHRMGSRYGSFFERNQFLGRNLWEDNWIQPDTHPYANLKEEDRTFVIEVVASGFKKEEIKISLQNHVLTIRGQKEKVNVNKSVYIKREYDTDSFTRVFELSPDFDKERITAKLKNGLLSIVLMRSDEQEKNGRNRKIDVL